MIDDNPGRRDDRRQLTKSAIAAVALELPDVNPNDLTAWDKAALDQVYEIKRAAELEEYRAELIRVFELAGLNYKLAEQNFWRKVHERAKQARSQD
jgi:hypothetical protein